MTPDKYTKNSIYYRPLTRKKKYYLISHRLNFSPIKIAQAEFLYVLLDPKMDWFKWKDFVISHPYRLWLLIKIGKAHIGTVILTNENKVEITILPKYKGLGDLHSRALELFNKEWPRT